MKTILVPVNYSEVANNALQYAAGLANFAKAKIVLLHTYQIPVPTTEVPIIAISPQELEDENLAQVKKLEKEIVEQNAGKIKVESIVRNGFVADEIVYTSKEQKADLIIMGVTGNTGKIVETLIGSNTTSVIKKSLIPVLTVPKDARFKKVEKIAIASDYHREISKEILQKLKGYIQLFDAKLEVVDIVNPVEVPTLDGEAASDRLESPLADIPHTSFFPSSNNITEEINHFVDDHKSDWLVMVPHKHKFLSALFHRSNTKKMAFHTHIPLLTLHD